MLGCCFCSRLGHFLVSTLPPVTFAERSLDLQKNSEQDSSDGGANNSEFRHFNMQQSFSGNGACPEKSIFIVWWLSEIEQHGRIVCTLDQSKKCTEILWSCETFFVGF